MRRDFLYLVAILDWVTRRVLGWYLSNTMDTRFCIETLRFNRVLEECQICIGMDGCALWLDNVFIERRWRSLKHGCIYLRAFGTGSDIHVRLAEWVAHYNRQHSHIALGGRAADEAYHTAPMRSEWRNDINRVWLIQPPKLSEQTGRLYCPPN